MSCAPLPGLPAEALTLEAIQQAFSNPVPWKVEPLFSQSFAPERILHSNARHAAVLIPLVQRPEGLRVLFTRRSEHLHHHAGQISFPGGGIESADEDAVAAALRETQEEVGVAYRFVHVLGTHPTLLTTTGFLITPVVGALLQGFHVQTQDSEVAEVFEVPLAVLMDPSNHELRHRRVLDGHGRYFYAIPWESHFIWGATAILLRNFYHFLAASFSSSMR